MANELTTTNYIEKSSAHEMREENMRIKRIIPSAKKRFFDPFILIDEFFMDEKSKMEDHVHKGFECITYLLDGGLAHSDDLDNNEILEKEDVLYFNAGKGYRHTEKPVDSMNQGIRIWINLPDELKEKPAFFQKQKAADFPLHEDDSSLVKTLVSKKSPLQTAQSVLIQDYSLAKNTHQKIAIPENHNAIIYLPGDKNGVLKTEYTLLNAGDAIFIEQQAEELSVKSKDAVRFLLISALPVGKEIDFDDFSNQ